MRAELRTLSDTKRAAKELARRLRGGDLLLLYGDLASGKTTFMKYLAAALGFNGSDVSSPSFTIINHYAGKAGRPGIYHVDLYRLGEGANLEPLGLETIISSGDIVAVEWPGSAEAAFSRSGQRRIVLRFELSAGKRVLIINPMPKPAVSI